MSLRTDDDNPRFSEKSLLLIIDDDLDLTAYNNI